MIDPVEVFGVVIVGGGPGGMAAAIWCSDLGLDAVLIEREKELGGQLNRVYNPITNYPGVSVSNGRELRDLIDRQVERSDVFNRLEKNAVALSSDPLGVDLADGTRIAGKALIIATGVRRRTLDIPGENEFAGRGILESGSKAGSPVAGRRVVIIGGGDAALENALILGRHAESVFVVHRRQELTSRREFVEAARELSNVTFLLDCSVTAIIGDERLAAVEILSNTTGESRRLPVENVLIRIGVEPNSELVADVVETDRRGYVVIDRECQTSVEGIYAIGDVANPSAPTISGAIGHAATAVKVIADKLHRKTHNANKIRCFAY